MQLNASAPDLAINGTNQIVYQDSNNDSDVLPTGTAGQILASSGAGAAPQWVNLLLPVRLGYHNP